MPPLRPGYGGSRGEGPVIDDAQDAAQEQAWQSGRSELSVPCHPRWISAVRAFVSGSLRAWGWDQSDVEVAALLVGEVAGAPANSGGPGRLVVVVEPADGLARVTVHDPAAVRLVPRPAGGDADGGRGLQILETLAERWGTTGGAAGRSVWFEVGRDGPG